MNSTGLFEEIQIHSDFNEKDLTGKRLKPLPHKHEDQSLDSQNPHKCQKGVMAHL